MKMLFYTGYQKGFSETEGRNIKKAIVNHRRGF